MAAHRPAGASGGRSRSQPSCSRPAPRRMHVTNSSASLSLEYRSSTSARRSAGCPRYAAPSRPYLWQAYLWQAYLWQAQRVSRVIERMTMKTRTKAIGLVVWAAAAMGLASTAGADSSAIATVLDMSFDGELTTTVGWNLRSQIEGQLRYTIGSLNAFNSVGRLDKVALTNVWRTSVGGGRDRVTYHAQTARRLGQQDQPAAVYTFTLPRDVSFAGLEAFTDEVQDHLRRLRRARRRPGQHVVLLPARRRRAARSPTADIVTVHRVGCGLAASTPPASTPSTTRSGRTARSTWSPSSASTKTARPPGGRRHQRLQRVSYAPRRSDS